KVPKDVIVKFHYFAHKEQQENLPRSLTLTNTVFADLPAATMARRKTFITITKTLGNNNVSFKWGYPTKLLIWRQGKTHMVNDPAEGMKSLIEW
ncbi:Hypothetical predicted protein, partial [Pelobates cultripes]